MDENDNPDLRQGSLKLLRNHGGPLEICHVSIGEAFARMAEDITKTIDQYTEAAREFHLMISNGSFRVCGFHNHRETHKLALRLHDEDSLLEANDGIILANALLCEDCHTFYTIDNQMLFGKVAQTIASEMGKTIASPTVLDTNKNRRKRYGKNRSHR